MITDCAKMIGITPAVFTRSGMCVFWPPYIFRPTTRFAYCTGIFRCACVIATTEPDITGIDIYIGQGGAPEGVLAAAALRCVGGQFQTRLVFRNDVERQRAHKLGIRDLHKKYMLQDLASGDVVFAATGVTSGTMLEGVRFEAQYVTTHSIVMRSATKTVRWIKMRHPHNDGG